MTGYKTYKRDNKKEDKAGVPVKQVKTITFNPNSRDHIASRLKLWVGNLKTLQQVVNLK